MKLWAQLAIATAVAAAALGVASYRSEDRVALWLTPDQQGRRAYEVKEFSNAADLFEDPQWKGTAAYASGRYLEAAEAFGRLPTAIGFFNRGDALIKGREYVQAIPTFEQAVVEDPDWPDAVENLDLARYILDYLEQARGAEGTDSEGTIDELGADEYKFDASVDAGTEMQIDRNTFVQALSAEKWMRTVNTETGDFLRSRFALEASWVSVPVQEREP